MHPRKYFRTETGTEVPALTSEQMREVDRIAMEETGPNLYQMMENAGRTLASLAIDLLTERWKGAKIVVLAGSGGNGGGGICAARHLANRGTNVRLVLAEGSHLGEVPSFQRKIFQSTCGKEIPAARLGEDSVDLIIDALIGYGLKSAAAGPTAELIRWANGAGAPILALDVPSGTDATTGISPGDFVRAQWTMTLALPKTGLSAETGGSVYLADIGIPEGTYARMGLKFAPVFGNRFLVRLDV